MTNTLEEFTIKFEVTALTVVKMKYWTWSLRPVHCTLGAGVLSLNRFCASFSSITTDEAVELATITKTIESKLNRAFCPDKFNYLMLMMVDAHLHFHVIPRYESPKHMYGKDWADTGWPTLPALGESSKSATPEILRIILKTLKEN